MVLLPENLFYNTSAPGIVLVINKAKQRPDEILLVNASKLFTKGRPKNHLTDDHITAVADLYEAWKQEEGVSAIVDKAEAIRNDYNLSPSRYVSTDEAEDVLPLEDAVVLLKEAEEERAAADEELNAVLSRLGLQGSP